jgi:hypothetical protein
MYSRYIYTTGRIPLRVILLLYESINKIFSSVMNSILVASSSVCCYTKKENMQNCRWFSLSFTTVQERASSNKAVSQSKELWVESEQWQFMGGHEESPMLVPPNR